MKYGETVDSLQIGIVPEKQEAVATLQVNFVGEFGEDIGVAPVVVTKNGPEGEMANFVYGEDWTLPEGYTFAVDFDEAAAKQTISMKYGETVDSLQIGIVPEEQETVVENAEPEAEAVVENTEAETEAAVENAESEAEAVVENTEAETGAAVENTEPEAEAVVENTEAETEAAVENIEPEAEVVAESTESVPEEGETPIESKEMVEEALDTVQSE